MLWWLIPFAVVVLIIVIIGCAILVKRFKSMNDDGIETIVQPTVSMHNVVSFFKQPDKMRKLQSSKDNIAVAIREKEKDGSCCILLSVFNKTTGSIVSSEDSLRYKVSYLSEDLKTAFGDKNMIILQ